MPNLEHRVCLILASISQQCRPRLVAAQRVRTSTSAVLHASLFFPRKLFESFHQGLVGFTLLIQQRDCILAILGVDRCDPLAFLIVPIRPVCQWVRDLTACSTRQTHDTALESYIRSKVACSSLLNRSRKIALPNASACSFCCFANSSSLSQLSIEKLRSESVVLQPSQFVSRAWQTLVGETADEAA